MSKRLEMLRIALLLCLLGFAANAALTPNPESGWLVRSWRSDEGLPDNRITCTAQSGDGYLWVGTRSGLARFDGMRFEFHSLQTYLSGTDRIIRGLREAKDGSLWVALDMGVMLHATGNFAETFGGSNGLPSLAVRTMAEDRDGSLWIAYTGGEIYRLKTKGPEAQRKAELLRGDGGSSMTVDELGDVWIARQGILGVVRGGSLREQAKLDQHDVFLGPARGGGVWICSGSRLLRYDPRDGLDDRGLIFESLPSLRFMALLEDRSGAVWIGTTTDGLFRYADSQIEPIQTSHKAIYSLAEDREGNIWVGTGGGGLNRISRKAVELHGVANGLPFDTVASMAEDREGKIWAVTQDGTLAVLSGKTWQTVSTNVEWPGGKATCVAADPAGGVWIGTQSRRLYYLDREGYKAVAQADGLQGGAIQAMLVSSKGELWLCSAQPDIIQCLRGGRFVSLTPPAGMGTLRAISEDAAGNIWAGTTRGALLKISHGILTDETSKITGELKSIRCLYSTPDGALWIGYAGSGLGVFHKGRFTFVREAHGLQDETISQIVADESGWMWFGGQEGLCRIKQQDLEDLVEGRIARVRSIAYGRWQGLPSLQANFGRSPASLRSRDGRLWIPMLTGLAVIRPERLRENLEPPPVVLERLNLDDRCIARYASVLPQQDDIAELPAQPGRAGIRLPPRHRKIEFEFTALTFVEPENVGIRYRLDPFDADWIESGPVRRAVYSRLAAGDYAFRVQACNNDGVWNETGTTLALTVAPFVWQTWWFRILVLVLITAGAVALARYAMLRRMRTQLHLLEQQEALHIERARISRDLHDDLGASLTQIGLLSELAQQELEHPKQATKHLDQVFRTAHDLTRSLDEIVWALNQKTDTLESFVGHLCSFAPRFLSNAGMRCRVDVPMDLPASSLASDIRHHLYFGVKETLNNVLKHAAASEVWLRIVLRESTLQIIVEDNGKGIRASDSEGSGKDGLANLHYRMKEIKGSFQQRSGAHGGTITIFEAPLSIEAPA